MTKTAGMSLQEFAWCLRHGMQELDVSLFDAVASSDATISDVIAAERKRMGVRSDRLWAALNRLLGPVIPTPGMLDHDGDEPLRILTAPSGRTWVIRCSQEVVRPGDLGLIMASDPQPPEVDWPTNIWGPWNLDEEIMHILAWIHAIPGISISKLVRSMGYHPLVESPVYIRGKLNLEQIDRGQKIIRNLIRPYVGRRVEGTRPPLAIDVHAQLGINRSRLVLTSAGKYAVGKLAEEPSLVDGKVPPPLKLKPAPDNWEW